MRGEGKPAAQVSVTAQLCSVISVGSAWKSHQQVQICFSHTAFGEEKGRLSIILPSNASGLLEKPGRGGNWADLKGHEDGRCGAHTPFPPRRPPPRSWARAHPAGAGSGSPRAGGRSPDEVLQALLAGVPPQDRAGHGAEGPAAAPSPAPQAAAGTARSRGPLSAFRKFCSWFPFVSASPPCSTPPACLLHLYLLLLLPPCLVEVSRGNLWGRSTKPGAPHSPARGILSCL